MATSVTSIKHRRQRVFSSVFPTASSLSTCPTPLATPNLSYVSPVQSFDGLPVQQLSLESVRPTTSADERIAWNRAWHAATSLLSLPAERVGLHRHEKGLMTGGVRDPTPTESSAIEYVLSQSCSMDGSAATAEEQDLLQWHTNEVRRHFLAYTKPELQSVRWGHSLLPPVCA